MSLPALPEGKPSAEDADFDAQFARVHKHGVGGATKQVIEQWPIVVEERPQQMGHDDGDVLPVTVGTARCPCAAGLGLGLAALAGEA